MGEDGVGGEDEIERGKDGGGVGEVAVGGAGVKEWEMRQVELCGEFRACGGKLAGSFAFLKREPAMLGKLSE